MAINLCWSPLRTEVSCDRVCHDGHEPSNLLHPVSSLSNRGFMVERFIKPPVCLTFNFAFCVEVNRIVFCSRLGSQGATRFEVYSHCSLPGKTPVESNRLFSAPSNKKHLPSDQIYQKLAYANSQDKTVFSFTNKNCTSQSEVSSSVIPQRIVLKSDESSHKLYYHNFAYLQRVDSVTIKILSAVPSGVAAIKWIEIWGNPARGTPGRILTRIKEIITSVNKPLQEEAYPKDSSTSDPSCKKHLTDCDKDIDNDKDAPVEFLDPLTQELMALPMLLPCGQTVDAATLEHHAAAEARWGRSPSDPFTGILFSSSSKPVPNATLKVRIDEYLLKNGERLNIHKVGFDKSDKSRVSVLVKERNKTAKEATSFESSAFKRSLPNEKDETEAGHDTHCKKKASSSFTLLNRKVHDDPENISSQPKKRFKISTVDVVDLTLECDEQPCIDGLLKPYVPKRSSSKLSHKKELDRSLENALSSTLSSFPSFRKPSSCQSSAAQSSASPHGSSYRGCGFCDSHTQSQLYLLPCQHTVCRSCAIGLRLNHEAQCNVCSVPFDCSSISKLHAV